MFQLIKDFQEIKIKLKIIFIIFALLILEQFDYCAMAQTQLQPIVSIASGGQVFLRADGSVWSFTDMRYLAGPIEIPGLDEIVRVGFDNVSTGYALRRDGTVWSWEVTCRLPDESTETCIHTNSKRLQGLTEITDFSVGH